MGIGAKSLILDLLATLRAGAVMPVGVLVEAGSLFGISGNNIRVSAARLLADGLIARDERGCYRLGDRSVPIGRRIRSWRDLDRRTRAWGGGWISVLNGPVGRAAARRRERALELLGFRRLRETLWIRPDNLALSLAELRVELSSLGLTDQDLLCRLRDFDEVGETCARSLWNVDELSESYGTLRAEIERGADRLSSLGTEEAMVESFMLGGRALRQLVRDPLLPEELWPSRERDSLLAAMREYDRLGRLAWAEMLKRWGVPYLRAPLDGRSESERPRLAG